MQEYKRILTKKLIITVILCMLLNIALFLYGQLEGRNINDVISDSRQYSDLISRLKTQREESDFEGMFEDVTQIIKQDKEDGKESSASLVRLRKKLKYLSGFTSQVNECLQQAEQMRGKKLFSNKKSYSYNNILKTAEDYSRIADVKVVLVNDMCIEKTIEYKYTYYLLAVCMIVMIYECFKERDNGMWQIVHSSKSGRMILALKRFIFVWIYAFVLTFIYFVSTVIVSVLLYGVCGIWKAPVQSIETMSGFTIKCNMAAYMCLLCLIASFVLAMFGSIILALFTVIRNRNIVLIGSVIFAGAEYLLYKNISLQSRISFLRVVNIINFFDINTLLSKYANWGFKTFVVSSKVLIITGMAVVTIIMSVAALIKSVTLRPFGAQNVLKKLFNKAGELYQRIFALYPPVIKEMHKLIFTGKGFFVIAIGLVLTLYICGSGKMVFSESQKEYDNIYIQKGGEDYSQLKSEIDELNSRYDSIQIQLKDMQEAYKNREVSDDEFLYAVNAAQTLKYAIQNKEELINKIDYLANIENQYNKKGWLISDRGYEQFFGKYGRLRECVLVGLMAAIIFIVVSRGAEIRYSTGMNIIENTSAEGRKKLALKRDFAAIIFSAAVVLILSIVDLGFLSRMYNLTYKNAPLVSLSFIGDYLGKGIGRNAVIQKIILSSSIAGFLIIRIVLRIITGFVVTAAALLSGTFAARKKNAAVVPIVMAVVVLITVFIFNGLAIF